MTLTLLNFEIGTLLKMIGALKLRTSLIDEGLAGLRQISVGALCGGVRVNDVLEAEGVGEVVEKVWNGREAISLFREERKKKSY